MKDFLFVNPFLHPPGGGEGVANWMIDALASRGSLTVLTWDPPDLDAIDRYYGTDLSGKAFESITVARWTRMMVRGLRIPHKLLTSHSLMKRAKAMRPDYRHCFTAYNDMDLGPPAVQYIHHPTELNERSTKSYRPTSDSFLVRAAWPAYLGLIRTLGERDVGNIRKNITIVNSYWTGRGYQAMFDAPVHRVIYPPPLGDKPLAVTAPTRKEAFLSVARLDRSKEWPKLIAIMEQVRALGHDVGLTLAGSRYDEGLLLEIQTLAERHRPWLTLVLDQPRKALDRLMADHKYAIHGMVDEHYGMAVAELVLAGCLTLVPDSGGQIEIVPQQEARYRDIGDAVVKIDALLSSTENQEALAAAQAKNREKITRQTFLAEFHSLVDDLEAGRVIQPIQL